MWRFLEFCVCKNGGVADVFCFLCLFLGGEKNISMKLDGSLSELELLSSQLFFFPQTGLPIWGSYSFQRVASVGRMILPLSPGFRSTLGALGRMILHLSPTCLPLWVPWTACFTLVSHLFSRLTQNMLLLELCQLPRLAAALDSFTSVWGQRWYNFGLKRSCLKKCFCQDHRFKKNWTVWHHCLQMFKTVDLSGGTRLTKAASSPSNAVEPSQCWQLPWTAASLRGMRRPETLCPGRWDFLRLVFSYFFQKRSHRLHQNPSFFWKVFLISRWFPGGWRANPRCLTSRTTRFGSGPCASPRRMMCWWRMVVTMRSICIILQSHSPAEDQKEDRGLTWSCSIHDLFWLIVQVFQGFQSWSNCPQKPEFYVEHCIATPFPYIYIYIFFFYRRSGLEK